MKPASTTDAPPSGGAFFISAWHGCPNSLTLRPAFLLFRFFCRTIYLQRISLLREAFFLSVHAMAARIHSLCALPSCSSALSVVLYSCREVFIFRLSPAPASARPADTLRQP